MPFYNNWISCLKKPSAFFTKDVRTFIVVSTVGLAQGLNFSCDVVFSYIYKIDYRLTPSQSSIFDSTNQLPWMIKPLWGALSDSVSLFGYKRKSYLLIMALICWICMLSFGVAIPPWIAGFFILFFMNLSLSFMNCIAEAVLVETAQDVGRKNNMNEQDKIKAASKGVSTFFGAKYAGRVLGAIMLILFLDEAKRRQYLLGASFIPLVVFALSFLLPEVRRRSGKRLIIQPSPAIELHELEEDSKRQEENFSSDNSDNNEFQGQNIKKAFNFIKNPLIYKSIFLLFICGFIPQSPQTKFYYYTGALGFKPEFIGALKLITYVAVLLAILTYNRYLRNIDFRRFYTGTALLGCALTLSQLILIFRLNQSLGIRDEVFAVFDTFVLEMVLEFNALPMLVFACRLCPKDIEATIFALFMSVSNAGYILSLQLGGLLTYLLNITSKNFDNLWMLTVISALFYLIPLTVLWTFKFENAVKHVEAEEVVIPDGDTANAPNEENRRSSDDAEQPVNKSASNTSQLQTIKHEIFSELALDEHLHVYS